MSSSRAVDEFFVALELAESLMAIDRERYSNPPRRNEQKAVEGLRGGAAILMVAGFERFLRRLMEVHIFQFAQINPPVRFDKLPDKMRIHSVFITLEHALKGKPHKPKKMKTDRLTDVDRACRKVIAEVLNPDAFSDTGSNPNSETVKQMFSNLSIQDVFGMAKNDFEAKWGSPIAQTFIRDKLDEIVNRRHVVAHTADALNIGRAELRTSIKFLKILVSILDDLVKSHIDQIIASA